MWRGAWDGPWDGPWEGAAGGALYGDMGAVIRGAGSLVGRLEQPNKGAGKGSKTLADYEAEWANAEKQPEPARVRRRIKREAARVLYTETIALPTEQRERLTELQARKEAATLAETKALLDLMVSTSQVQAEIARAAARIARKQAEEAARLIEELDVMYVAAILAEA